MVSRHGGRACKLRAAGLRARAVLAAHVLALRCLAEGPVAVLYNGGSGNPSTTPNQEGWQTISTDLNTNFFTAGSGVTNFDSRYRTSLVAGWATHGAITGNQIHPLAPVLDAAAGFTVRFQLAVDEELHLAARDFNGDGVVDRAGFSMVVIASDGMGISLNFWQDRLWVSGDDTEGGVIFAQCEGVPQSPMLMATLREYALTIYRGAYRLSVDGQPVLDGRRRDYRSFTGFTLPSGNVLNIFNKPNMIAPGDGSLEASAAVRLGPLSVESCFVPGEFGEVTPLLEDGLFRVQWPSTPGRGYQLEWWSAPGEEWVPGEELTAELFTSRSNPVMPVDSGIVRVRLLSP